MTLLAHAVSGRFGPVEQVVQLLRPPWGPKVSIYLAFGYGRLDLDDVVSEPFEVVGGGFDEQPTAARDAAIGECIERLTASVAPAVRSDPPEDAARTWLRCFSPEQRSTPGFPFADEHNIVDREWIPAQDGAGAQVSVPLEVASLAPTSAQRPICIQTSTGLAASTSREAASSSALYEVIERDALMTFWRLRVDCPTVRLVGDAALEVEGAEVTLIWLSALSDGFSVAAVICRSEDAFGFGCCADPDPKRAAHRATVEATVTWSTIRVESFDGTTVERSLDEISQFEHHPRYHSHHPELLDFVARRTSPVAASVEEALDHNPLAGDRGPTDLDALVQVVERAGHRPLFVDLTTEESLGAGVHVVRALVPSYNAIDMLGSYPHLHLFRSTARLKAATKIHGPLYRSNGVNSDPHPMP